MIKQTFTKLKLSMPSIKQFSTSAVKGDLYRYQKELPKLPVPTLAETAEKYLSLVQPLLNEEQFKSTTAKVQDFVKSGGVGEILQERLQQFAANPKVDNWLAEWWDDYAYMLYRDPVVPYVSYFFSHKDVNNAIGKDQLLKATLIVYYTVEFMTQVQNETLEPEIIKGNPYCMNAFRYMFNNSRIPAPGADTTKLYDGSKHRYLIVGAENNFYKVYHHDTADKPLSKAQIYQQLQTVLNDARKRGKAVPIGALTSLNRDEWLSLYVQLLKLPLNAASLEALQASSFFLALDSSSPVTIEEKSRSCWHGDGQNRYFDKPLEFIVSANGNSGFLGEHSRMDATPTVQMNNFILGQIAKEDPETLIQEVNSITTPISALPVAELPATLPFDITTGVRFEIASAVGKFQATIESLDEEIFQYQGYGKNLIKQFKVSPDAYVQMLMQFAYYKATGKIRPTYESAATRKFLKGRTETGRTVSNESKAFVETWSNPNATLEEKAATFQAACKQHVNYLLSAAEGKGVDRHLFGLKNMLKEGESVPEIFTDPVYSYSSNWYLSTSQVPSENFQLWGWSQVIEEGFGFAYLVNKDWLHVHISCRKGNGLRLDHMKWYLTEAANEMRDTLIQTLPPKAKL